MFVKTTKTFKRKVVRSGILICLHFSTPNLQTKRRQAPHGNCTESPSPFNASQSMSYTDCQLYQVQISTSQQPLPDVIVNCTGVIALDVIMNCTGVIAPDSILSPIKYDLCTTNN